MRTRLLPEASFIRAVPRRDHRRLWSRRRTARIKIGSDPIFYRLEHRVNTCVPFHLICCEPALFCSQSFALVCMRIRLYFLTAMAENQEKGQKTKSRIKAAQKDVWADEEIDMFLNIFREVNF